MTAKEDMVLLALDVAMTLIGDLLDGAAARAGIQPSSGAATMSDSQPDVVCASERLRTSRSTRQIPKLAAHVQGWHLRTAGLAAPVR